MYEKYCEYIVFLNQWELPNFWPPLWIGVLFSNKRIYCMSYVFREHYYCLRTKDPILWGSHVRYLRQNWFLPYSGELIRGKKICFAFILLFRVLGNIQLTRYATCETRQYTVLIQINTNWPLTSTLFNTIYLVIFAPPYFRPISIA